MFAGDIGAKFRRTYTVLGDAVNTAARVMASCDADNQVRAMPEVLDLASSRFERVAQEPFAAKGKALPLSTFAVGESLGPRLSDTPLPLIGRDEELAALTQRFESAAAGHGGVLHVVGAAGIGKSRLVEQLRQNADAAGFATLTTFAERYERTTVYFVLRQLLGVIFDGSLDSRTAVLLRAMQLAPGHEAWFPLLGPPLGFEFEPTEETRGVDTDEIPAALGRLTLALLDGFLDGPSLWIAENAELADEASAAVISAVVKELGERPWLIVAVSRSDERGGLTTVGGPVVTVGPLSADDGTRLARIANPTLLPHDASVIAQRADGNPLFLRQLVSAAADGGDLSDSVETTVSARIDRLSAVDRDVLRTASVLGGRFELSALSELLGGRKPDVAPLQDFLMNVEGSLVFRQALYREVAYAGLTFKRRRALHLHAGRLLEQTVRGEVGPFGRLALHFSRAQAWELCWKYARVAADEAYVTVAKSLAAELYQWALEAGKQIPSVTPTDLSVVATQLGKALFVAGRREEARAAYRQGRRIAPKDSAELAELECAEGAVFHDVANLKQSGRWFRRAYATLEASGVDLAQMPYSETAVTALCGLADGLVRTGRVSEAVTLGERATAIAQRSHDHILIGRAHSLGMMIGLMTNDIPMAIKEGQAALDAHRGETKYKSTAAVQAMNLGVLKQLSGDWRGAREVYDEAYAVLHSRGDDAMSAAVQLNICEVLIDQGEWAEARRILDDLVPLFTSGEEYEFVRTHRTRLCIRTGVLDDIDLPDELTSFGLPDLVYGARIELALLRGDHGQARQYLAQSAEQDVELLLRPVFDALVGHTDMETALATAIEQEKPFAAVLARVFLGADPKTDPGARALGIVDLPVWVSRQMV